MDKKKLLVFDNGQHEYTVTIKETKKGKVKYTLKRSKGEQWNDHVRGEKILTVIEDDFNYKIKGLKNNLAYHEICEIKVLVDVIISRDSTFEDYEIVLAEEWEG